MSPISSDTILNDTTRTPQGNPPRFRETVRRHADGQGHGGEEQENQPIHDIDAGPDYDPANRIRRDRDEPDAAREFPAGDDD